MSMRGLASSPDFEPVWEVAAPDLHALGKPDGTQTFEYQVIGSRNGGTLEHAQQIARTRIAEDDEALRPDGGTR